MKRQESIKLRRLLRTFKRYSREAGSLDTELGSHLLRWFVAEYMPRADEIREHAMACMPGRGMFHTEMIKTHPESRAARLSQARLARYFRQPCRLPKG